MNGVENRSTFERLVDRAGLTPIQENLARADAERNGRPLAIDPVQESKVVIFLQTGLNQLGERGLMGADFKPLQITGKADADFITALQNYLADKRTQSGDMSIPSYGDLPDIKKAGDIGLLHVSAMMDSLQDNKILQADKPLLQPELLGALKEVNHPYLRMGIESIEQNLRKSGVPVSEGPKADVVSDAQRLQPYIEAHRTATGGFLKPPL